MLNITNKVVSYHSLVSVGNLSCVSSRLGCDSEAKASESQPSLEDTADIDMCHELTICI